MHLQDIQGDMVSQDDAQTIYGLWPIYRVLAAWLAKVENNGLIRDDVRCLNCRERAAGLTAGLWPWRRNGMCRWSWRTGATAMSSGVVDLWVLSRWVPLPSTS